MNSLNSILLEGNLVADPTVSTTDSGNSVCRFTVESERFYKDGEGLEREASRFEVEAWGRLGQTCADTLKKGRGLRVVGRLRQERWTEDGRDMSKVVVVAEHVEFKGR